MNRISHLLSKCLEPIAIEPPQFVLQLTTGDCLGYLPAIMRGESSERMDLVSRFAAANGREAASGEVWHAWSMRVNHGPAIGVACAIETKACVYLLELYMRRDYRRRGLGRQLLFVAERMAAKRRNPVIATVPVRDVDGKRWLQERGFYVATDGGNKPYTAARCPDGQAVTLIHMNDCGAYVRIAE